MRLPGFTAAASLERCSTYVGSGASMHRAKSVQLAQVLQPPDIEYWPLGPWLRPYDPCIYGNYCGPGCSGPGDPIDSVDSCCKEHDDCYTDAKTLKQYCECDQQLLKCMAEQSLNVVTDGPNAVVGATLVSTYFALQYSAFCVLPIPITETAKAIGEAWHNPLTTAKKAVTDLPSPSTEVAKAWHNPFDTIGKAFGGN
jgi:hypothetical protein